MRLEYESASEPRHEVNRCRAGWEQLSRFEGRVPQSQDQNLILTSSYAPSLLDRGWPVACTNNHFTEMCSSSEASSYLRLVDSCITQLKVQGPSRTCDESEREEEGSRDRGDKVATRTFSWSPVETQTKLHPDPHGPRQRCATASPSRQARGLGGGSPPSPQRVLRPSSLPFP